MAAFYVLEHNIGNQEIDIDPTPQSDFGFIGLRAFICLCAWCMCVCVDV